LEGRLPRGRVGEGIGCLRNWKELTSKGGLELVWVPGWGRPWGKGGKALKEGRGIWKAFSKVPLKGASLRLKRGSLKGRGKGGGKSWPNLWGPWLR